MKKLKFLGIAAASLIVAGCSEEVYEQPRPMPEEGDEVAFDLNLGAQSRTVYGPENEGGTAQSIFWGSYVAGEKENIRVFCPESPAGRGMAEFEVSYSLDATTNLPNDNYATALVRTSELGVQWGAQESGYNFYAVYPADKSGDTLNGTTVSVTVNNGQTPVNYGPDGTAVDNSLVLSPNTSTTAEAVTIYGNPDMSNAVMYACTPNVTKSDEKVPLHFNVLTDVLEVTVNGPEQDNTLLNGAKADYIEIRAIDVQSKSSKALGGVFNVDLTNGKYSGNPTTQVLSLHMNTTLVQNNTIYYPKLYCRANNTYDKLKVRFFLWPGAQASDLRIVVDTNCGQFTLENLTGSLDDGKIHKVSLPHFKTPGAELNMSRWMRVLDDNIYISELSIPGAFHAANPVFQTQAEFNSMYEAGVRAFEVQSFVTNGVAMVATGSDGSTRTLEDVLRTIGEKMAAHPAGFVYFLIGDPNNSNEYPAAVSAAVSACKDYIYQNPITENTTLGEVRGKIVLKINTNGADVNETGWVWNGVTDGGDFPALFTRWTWISVGEALNVSMQWGKPIAPNAANAPLRWYYNEQAQVNNGHLGDAYTKNLAGAIAAIKDAADDVAAKSLEAYQNGGTAHNMFYLVTIGGFYSASWIDPTNATTSMSQPFAEQLNPYVLTRVLDPSRVPSPTGIVLMNFCCGTTTDPSAYSSAELIRAIVYNNNNFIMKRKETTATTNP